jgi:hypothetical protein
MQVLVYMALVSNDADTKPWFSKGREAIAELALGRPAPFDRAAARAVERAIEPLLAIGAISTDRKASVRRDGDSTARYRLNLNLTDAPRIPWAEKEAHAPRNSSGVKGDEDPHRPTNSAPHAPRIPSSRPTDSVLTPHGNRGPEEKEDLSRSEAEEEMAVVETASHPPRATAETTTPESPTRPTKCPHGIKIKARTDGRPSCAVCRREQRSAGPPEPDPPPPGTRCRHGLPRADSARCGGCLAEHVAPVIDLRTRRPA